MQVNSDENSLVWTVRDLVIQHIKPDEKGVYHSGWITANAVAMLHLVNYGHMVLEYPHDEGSRDVYARMVEPEKTPNAFGKDVLKCRS